MLPRSLLPGACALAAALACAGEARAFTPKVPAGAVAPSPAGAQIHAALERIRVGRADAGTYRALAVGLTRRARESGDTTLYERALEALARADAIDPGDPETVKLSAWVRMGRHEFARAHRIARRYVKAHPPDEAILGVMGDALMELGRYDEAERAYQSMIDLRPGPASYSRASYILEARGEVQRASELMQMALEATARTETEERAWILVQIGHLRELSGEPGGGESCYRAALDLFPGYHYALAALARALLVAGQAEEAVALASDAVAAPHAEGFLLLADALRSLGREDEARAEEDRFEGLALANVTEPDNENHDVVLFYLERRSDPRRALLIARQEVRRRRDVHTLDRLAWAMHHNGKPRQARRLMEHVLSTGTRDPLILRHAREIRSAAPRRGAVPGA